MLAALLQRARNLGFIGIGFTRPGRPLFFDRFTAWLADRKYGDMAWLARNTNLREDPSALLKGCRTVISLAYPYPGSKPVTTDGFCVSRHADPAAEDYHGRLRRICDNLAGLIAETHAGSRSRICVDSAPVLEKSIASAGGIGFIGKNNLLIIPGHGSYFYLAEILTTALIEFAPPDPAPDPMETRCGSCALCVEACPTGALERPHYLDASRCLSYLTIEYKGKWRAAQGKNPGKSFFGCDRCQEVCPYNQSKEPPRIALPPLEDLLTMDETLFEKKFGRTALGRAGLEKLKTNIQAITGGSERI